MKNSWIIIVAIISLALVIFITFLQSKKNKTKLKEKTFKPIANTELVRNLPEYKSVQKKYKLLLLMLILLFIGAFVSASIIASRPTTITVAKPTYNNRDIMLCLDVSGSMDVYVKELLDYFSKLVLELKGQRVGLTIFDGVYLTLSPLTDDYDSLSELFIDLTENPSNYNMALYSANQTAGTSAIGTGVVGCVNSFDKLEELERSRTIILATDNFAGNDNISLTQASNYAKRYDIAIFGLSTSDTRSQEEIEAGSKYELEEMKEFREATINTGGSYYAFSSYGKKNKIVVSEIVQQILEQSAARYEGADTLVESDTPLTISIIFLILISLFFVLIWRLSL